MVFSLYLPPLPVPQDTKPAEGLAQSTPATQEEMKSPVREYNDKSLGTSGLLLLELFSCCMTLNEALCLCGCSLSYEKRKKSGGFRRSVKFHSDMNMCSHGV